MQFLYVFFMIFLMIFGLVLLVRILAKTMLDGSSRKFDVYVDEDDYIEEFVQNARKSAFIGRINIIKKDSADMDSGIACKYGDVRYISDWRQDDN